MLPAAPDVPSAPLARLVTPEGPGAAKVLRTSRTNEAIGLRSLQAQTAVPGLEQVMTKIATTDPKSATDILKGLGRHFKPGAINNLAAVRAWQGIAHFLEIGGEPKHLATFLGGGKTAEVWRALGRFTTLRPTDLRGIQEIVSTNRNVLDRVVGIAGGFEEPNSVFAGLGLLASRTESGFDQLVEQLASSNAAERQQALDALVEGVGIVVRSPTRRLRFEMRSIDGEPVLSVRYPGGGAANVPGRFDDLVRRLSKPLPSGLNLFDGTPSDVVATVERMGQAKGGGFVDQAERAAFEKTVAHYRDMVTRLAQGVDVTRNAIGDRREIDTVASAIPAGGTVWASGNKIRVWVDPGLFELKPGMPFGEHAREGRHSIGSWPASVRRTQYRGSDRRKTVAAEGAAWVAFRRAGGPSRLERPQGRSNGGRGSEQSQVAANDKNAGRRPLCQKVSRSFSVVVGREGGDRAA
jgi:hypothetical protein